MDLSKTMFAQGANFSIDEQKLLFMATINTRSMTEMCEFYGRSLTLNPYLINLARTGRAWTPNKTDHKECGMTRFCMEHGWEAASCWSCQRDDRKEFPMTFNQLKIDLMRTFANFVKAFDELPKKPRVPVRAFGPDQGTWGPVFQPKDAQSVGALMACWIMYSAFNHSTTYFEELVDEFFTELENEASRSRYAIRPMQLVVNFDYIGFNEVMEDNTKGDYDEELSGMVNHGQFMCTMSDYVTEIVPFVFWPSVVSSLFSVSKEPKMVHFLLERLGAYYGRGEN